MRWEEVETCLQSLFMSLVYTHLLLESRVRDNRRKKEQGTQSDAESQDDEQTVGEVQVELRAQQETEMGQEQRRWYSRERLEKRITK